MAGLDAPEVFVTAITPLDGTVFEQRMRVDLRIRNPNPVDLTIDGLDFTLEVNGSRLTRGLSSEQVTVPRLGEAVMSVTASTTLVDVLGQIQALGRSDKVEYEIHGRVFLVDAPRRSVSFRYGSTLIEP